MSELVFTVHDDHPQHETALIDSDLGDSNDGAAPLHEVTALSCFARASDGSVIGGVVGRCWGHCCELQQLWVLPSRRGCGIGSQLIKEFETHAGRRGCTSVYLETFSFQAPSLYRTLGYTIEYERTDFPHGITKFHMIKKIAS